MRAWSRWLGDNSGNAAKTIDQLFDFNNERTRDVLSYVTLRVGPAQLKREASIITQFGWPKPAPGEVVLVALDGDRRTLAAQRIATNDVTAAVGIGVKFLKQRRRPARNALTVMADARSEAKRSGRPRLGH